MPDAEFNKFEVDHLISQLADQAYAGDIDIAWVAEQLGRSTKDAAVTKRLLELGSEPLKWLHLWFHVSCPNCKRVVISSAMMPHGDLNCPYCKEHSVIEDANTGITLRINPDLQEAHDYFKTHPIFGPKEKG